MPVDPRHKSRRLLEGPVACGAGGRQHDADERVGEPTAAVGNPQSAILNPQSGIRIG